MEKVVFINGGGARVADIFCSGVPAGFETVCLAKEADEKEKAAALEDAAFLVLHPAALSDALLCAGRSLRLIQLLTAGYDKMNMPLCREMDIPVATNGGANAWAVAEHSVAMLLAIYRRLGACDRSVRDGNWRQTIPEFTTFELAGKTVGILGAGNIGRKAAKRYKAFDTNILYYDCFPSEYLEKEIGARRATLEKIVCEADVLSVHLPLFPETRSLIGKREFARMKPGMVLINTSRAEIIEEAALLEALEKNRIMGAGLDVFYEEPIAAGSRFLELGNVLLSPHVAGHSAEGWLRRTAFAWQNIQRISMGDTPLSLVQEKK
jgi:phosphoglycerate dehydrogenase-like enzyme